MTSVRQVLHISQADIAGGAERCAYDLMLGLHRAHINSSLLVGRHADYRSIDDSVHRLSRARFEDARISALRSLIRSASVRDEKRIELIATPSRGFRRYRNSDDFGFETIHAVSPWIQDPDTILHYHNLHGRYLNFAQVLSLSERYLSIFSVHDLWMMTGGCTQPLDCVQYNTGCSNCPQMPDTKSAISRNWQQKRKLYQQGGIHLVAPSQWAANKIEQGEILAGAIQSIEVIAHGVDTEVFKPRDKSFAKKALGINPDNLTVLSSTATDGPYKDVASVIDAVREVALHNVQPVTFIALGGIPRELSSALPSVVSVPFTVDRYELSKVLNAADISVYSSKAETFCLSVAECLAVGVPVVASDIGPLSDLVIEGVGALVELGDSRSMAYTANKLLNDKELRLKAGDKARNHIVNNFSQAEMIANYIDYYQRRLESWNSAYG